MNAARHFAEIGGTELAQLRLGFIHPYHTAICISADHAGDGDAGLTTLSGSSPVTLTTTGSGASGGSFTTGTFIANGSREIFNWSGGGSSYTVIGAISVFDVTGLEVGNSIHAQARLTRSGTQVNWPEIGWRLQTQTAPLKTGLGANWITVPGSTNIDSILLPTATTNGAVFFRLVFP